MKRTAIFLLLFLLAFCGAALNAKCQDYGAEDGDMASVTNPDGSVSNYMYSDFCGCWLWNSTYQPPGAPGSSTYPGSPVPPGVSGLATNTDGTYSLIFEDGSVITLNEDGTYNVESSEGTCSSCSVDQAFDYVPPTVPAPPNAPPNPTDDQIAAYDEANYIYNLMREEQLLHANPNYDPDSPFTNLGNPIDVADDPPISDYVSVVDLPTGTTPPTVQRMIAQSPARGNTEDLTHGTDGDVTGITPSEVLKSNDDLFSDMTSLVHSCTVFDSDLQSVGDDMIHTFRTGSGGNYSNATLNDKVSHSSVTIDYLKRFGTDLNDQLKANGYNINSVPALSLNYRPTYNGLYNKFHGLQILINDTEESDIQINSYSKSGTTWTAIVTVTIYDHFGLDKHDATTYQGYSDGFAAWWLLQHTRGYVPMTTVVTFQKQLFGRVD